MSTNELRANLGIGEVRQLEQEQQAREFQEWMKQELGFPWFTVVAASLGFLGAAVAFYKMVEALFT